MPKIKTRTEKPNPVEMVPLKRHATPYHFVVSLVSQAGQERLYRGGAWRSAYDAYWQAINLVRHFSWSATVRMDLTEDRESFGGFVTEIEEGQNKSLHIPYDECLKWAYRKWTTQNTPEKIIALIPGMLRPVRHQRQPPPSG